MVIGLIGYRGAGKTTVARCLAERLAWEAVDADELLETRAGMAIRQIFAEHGEAWFRRLESEILAELVQLHSAVLSLGGGVILSESNRERLKRIPVVWLDAPAEALHARIQADVTTSERRPNLTQAGGLEEIRALLAARRPLYEQTARLRLEVEGKTPAEITDEILASLESDASPLVLPPSSP